MAESNLRKVMALQRVFVRDDVLLRPLEKEDATPLLSIFDEDPSIRERVGVAARLKSVNDVEELIDKEKEDPDIIRYVICEHDVVVGMVNFWRAGDFFGDKADPDDYGFGYFLSPRARGKGIVTGSLGALMNVATQELGATTFVAFCEADNAASGALLKKVGFEPTGDSWVESNNGWVEQKYQRIVPRSVQ